MTLWATVHGVVKSQTRWKWLSMHASVSKALRFWICEAKSIDTMKFVIWIVLFCLHVWYHIAMVFIMFLEMQFMIRSLIIKYIFFIQPKYKKPLLGYCSIKIMMLGIKVLQEMKGPSESSNKCGMVLGLYLPFLISSIFLILKTNELEWWFSH